ncbi:MAG: hypothetical protein K1X94_20250 [Sandaracinaceae bacterium]|nr:hypothetical protein [Sandaracinaceae bacterium]
MNFFAHLVVARRVERDPAFLLGAMLPDFATMSGARLAATAHPVLGAGIAEHHRTDDAFHATPTFIALASDMGTRLDAAGLPWGAARAIAHVGTELFLDGELTEDEPSAGDYVRAIASAAHDEIASAIRFREEEGHARFRRMHARLATHGPPHRYREPEFVQEVLVRILAGRPRLSVPDEHHASLLVELYALRDRVHRAREALVGETLDALGRAR